LFVWKVKDRKDTSGNDDIDFIDVVCEFVVETHGYNINALRQMITQVQ
jgi:hypothetical protein